MKERFERCFVTDEDFMVSQASTCRVLPPPLDDSPLKHYFSGVGVFFLSRRTPEMVY